MVTKKRPAEKLSKAPTGTVFAQLQKLDAERAKLEQSRQGLLETAKSELLTRGKEVIDSLAALGFPYKFSTSVAEKSHKAAPKTVLTTKSKKHRQSTQAVCPVCRFGTRPSHDGRTHRHLKIKAPFSAAELAERGLTRI